MHLMAGHGETRSVTCRLQLRDLSAGKEIRAVSCRLRLRNTAVKESVLSEAGHPSLRNVIAEMETPSVTCRLRLREKILEDKVRSVICSLPLRNVTTGNKSPSVKCRLPLRNQTEDFVRPVICPVFCRLKLRNFKAANQCIDNHPDYDDERRRLVMANDRLKIPNLLKRNEITPRSKENSSDTKNPKREHEVELTDKSKRRKLSSHTENGRPKARSPLNPVCPIGIRSASKPMDAVSF